MRIALAAMILNIIGKHETAVVGGNENRLVCALGFGDSLMECAGRESAAIDGTHPHARSETRIRRRRPGYHVRQSSIFFAACSLNHDAQGEAEIKPLIYRLAHAHDGVLLIIKSQL